jgi:hypothetical protein
MKYMPILPIGMSKLFQYEGHFKDQVISDAFILPQFWSNPEYKAMYVNRMWDTVIIDNSMYENSAAIPFEELIEMSKELYSRHTLIVPPEDPDDPIKTAQITQDTINEYDVRGPTWNMLTIIHGLPSQAAKMFELLWEHDGLGFGVAVSMWRAGYDRAAVMLSCPCASDHYFHAMGLDSISEMVGLSEAGFDSVDSSMVATAAVNHIPLSIDTVIRRYGIPGDPKRVPILQSSFPIETIEETSANIQEMLSLLDI